MVAAGRMRRGSAASVFIRDWVLRFNARGPDGLVDGGRTLEAQRRSPPRTGGGC